MKILDKAKAHYKSVQELQPREIVIKEWDDAKVYVRPTINLAQQSEINKAYSDGDQDDAVALTLIYRLMDENGKSAFPKGAREMINRELDSRVLLWLVREITKDDLTEEETEKNS